MSSKAQKKAGFLLPDPVLGWPLMDVCLKIPDAPEYRRAFLGHLYKLGLWAIWEKSYLPDDTRAKEAAELWRETLNAYLDMGCNDMGCCPEPQKRLNADGSMSVSFDGGLTWEPAGDLDPRTTSPQFPPLPGESGDDKKCATANNIVRQLKDQQIGYSSKIGTVATVVEMAALLAALAVSMFLTAGLASFLAASFFTLAAALLTTTTGDYNALFTDADWSWILCELYCKMGADGLIPASEFVNIQSDFDSHFSGNEALTFSSILAAWQITGLNNAGRVPTTDNLDCSGCCPECSDQFVINLGTSVSHEGGVWVIDSVFSDGRHQINISTGDPAKCCIVAPPDAPLYTDLVDWIACGDPIDGDHLHAGMVGPECVSTIVMFQTTNAFTATFTFTDC